LSPFPLPLSHRERLPGVLGCCRLGLGDTGCDRKHPQAIGGKFVCDDDGPLKADWVLGSGCLAR
jgi:hypothetical protein